VTPEFLTIDYLGLVDEQPAQRMCDMIKALRWSFVWCRWLTLVIVGRLLTARPQPGTALATV
jgi:hypothetical protein